MCRLSLSDSDKQVRDWFVKTTEALGCKTVVDNMGNIFAVRPGLQEGPPTFAGSHLDTQPSGTSDHLFANLRTTQLRSSRRQI
jgi:acetylornithine deacetylase/succinyl-diaminopimelate desuccinylase-like protein